MTPVLQVRGVTHAYGSATVLHDVWLDVEPGELLALAGRSGSGKSTLCHLAAGLESPGSGDVLVDGAPAADVDDWSVRALLPQRLGLAGELSVGENALLPCWLRGVDPPEDLLASLSLHDIAHAASAQTSLGEQQRTALARALSLRPRLVLLDEPTGHQDDDNVVRVIDALSAARDAGTTVVVATHDDRVLAAASRVVRLESGRVVG